MMSASADTDLKPMVFVIEDDLDHQKIAEMTLKSAGIKNITFFSTGEEAMDFFSESDPPDTTAERIILIDLMLPQIGGLEILQQLREDSRWGSSRMVVLTCSTSQEHRLQSEKLGADEFFSKPLRLEYVQKIIAF